MTKLCDNPECQFHELELVGELAKRGEIRVRRKPNGPEQVIRRHKYLGEGREFYLCSCCHSAVEMVRYG